MKTIIGLIVLCIGMQVSCQSNNDQHKSFYCQKTPQAGSADQGRLCWVKNDTVGCEDAISKGGCFVKPVAYCFMYTTPDVVYCFRYLSDHDPNAYANCVKKYPRTLGLGTQTDCNPTLDECETNRSDLYSDWGSHKYGDFHPPLFTKCRDSLPSEVNPD
jgi:hypothetical protein